MHLDCFPHDLIGSYRSCFLTGTVSSLLKVLKMCVFFGLETCILLRNLDDTSSSRKSFCTAKLGTKLCHTRTWLQLTCLHVCVWVRACVHERKNNIMMKCHMDHKNCTCPFIQLLETRMILTNNTKLGRTKRSCWRITTGRWWKGIAKILKKEMTMSPRHSPHSPPRTFRWFGFSDVDDHLSDIVLALVQVKPEVVFQREIWYYQLIMAKKVWNLIWCDNPVV